jgi:hypothetical protein
VVYRSFHSVVNDETPVAVFSCFVLCRAVIAVYYGIEAVARASGDIYPVRNDLFRFADTACTAEAKILYVLPVFEKRAGPHTQAAVY